MHIDDIDIAIDDGGSEGSIVTVAITTTHGRLLVMGVVMMTRHRIVIDDMHIGGPGANSWGRGRLMALGRRMLEKLDVDEIIIAGAARTTGANPGRRPNILRIARAGSSSGRHEFPNG